MGVQISVVRIGGTPGSAWWKRAPRPTVRQIAQAVSMLQVVEGMTLHAERDGCILHTIQAEIVRRHMAPVVPSRLMRDSEWRHRHIEAPGVRIQARLEEQERSDG